MRVRSPAVRAGRLPAAVGDAGLAAALSVAWTAEVVLNDARPAPLAATLVAGWALIAPVAWRRRSPVIALATRSVLTVIADAAGTGVLDGPHNVQGIAAAVLIYSVGAHRDGRALAAGVAVAVLTAGAHAALTGRPPAVGTALGIAAVVAAPVVTGRAMRQRRLLGQALEERAARLRTEQAGRAHRAAEAERRRIAGELHDVITHVLGEMVVLAGALRRAGRHDGTEYARVLGDIEGAGREALVELRRLLGVLRGGAAQPLGLMPTAAHVDRLIDGARQRGVRAELVVDGRADDVPTGIAVSIYRVVEAAVAHAVASGAPCVRVGLRHARHTTDVDVVMEPPIEATRPELLATIRERVAVCGGESRVERRPGGGVRMWARFPHRGGGSATHGSATSVPTSMPVASTRAGGRSRPAVPAALAAAVFAALTIDGLAGDELHGDALANLAAFALLASTFAWRPRAPLAAAVALAATAVALTAFLTPVPELQTAQAAFLGMVYLTAAGTHGRRALAGFAALAAAALATVTLSGLDELTSRQVYALVTFAALAWFAGRLVRTQGELNRTLAERARALERRRDEDQRRAVEDVRREVARELHDVVAYSLTVMVVQAGSARKIAEADPDEAARAVELIEAAGRDALAEMRRLLVVMAADEAPAPRAAAPGVASLERLLEHGRAAGLHVDLRRDGTARPLPAGIDIAAYRVVQEALTNTIKHAHASRAELVVRYRDDELELLVTDDGDGTAAPLPGSGHGLAGMRERVGVYGGELEARVHDGGGYVVRARFPLESAS